MSWLATHWVEVLAAATSVITAASVIVKMTPDKHDDEIVNKLLRVLQWLSINGGQKK